MFAIEGCIPALVTPFKDDREQNVHFDRLAELVTFQVGSGSSGVVLCGTSGESPTLSPDEHSAVLRTALAAARGTGLKIIAGSGSNSTQEAVHLTEKAAELGVDACLVVVPYYNKPTVEGLYAHFKRLNEVGIPLIVYNIPGRTGINMPPSLIAELAIECPYIVGLKASNGCLDEIIETAALTRERGKPFAILSGDDSLTLPILAVGGVGVISVVANIMPQVMNELIRSFRADRDFARAAFIAQTLHPLCTALLKLGSNPAPIKALMNRAGIEVGGCRLPLMELKEEQAHRLVTIVRTVADTLRSKGVAVDTCLERLSRG